MAAVRPNGGEVADAVDGIGIRYGFGIGCGSGFEYGRGE
jgi:hypothetical protein